MLSCHKQHAIHDANVNYSYGHMNDIISLKPTHNKPLFEKSSENFDHLAIRKT